MIIVQTGTHLKISESLRNDVALSEKLPILAA